MKQTPFSLRAATAYAAIIAAAAPVTGQIQYTDLNPSFDIDYIPVDFGVIDVIDLDGDGDPDFRFWAESRSYGLGLRVNAVDGDFELAGSHYNNFFSDCPVGIVKKAENGKMVDGSLDFDSIGRFWINTFPCGDIGDWEPGNVGFVGLRKNTPAGPHYGWMRVERASVPEHTYRILDFALQASPNIPVAAGDVGDTCLAPHSPSFVPDIDHPMLRWSKVPNAIGYRVEGNSFGGGPTRSRELVANETRLKDWPFGFYTWKVRAECPSGPSVFSPTAIFVIGSLRTTEHDPDVTAGLLSASKVKYTPVPWVGLLGHSAEGQAQVSLSDWDDPVDLLLFDMSGRLVWQAQNVSGDVADVPLPAAGMFALRVSAGAESQSLLIPSQ